jgi:hypothetical protein
MAERPSESKRDESNTNGKGKNSRTAGIVAKSGSEALSSAR